MKLTTLIIGNGHYVSGLTPLGDALHSDKDRGVLLPCTMALRGEGLVGEIVLCATDGDKLATARRRAETMAATFRWDPNLSIRPEEGQRDDEAYLTAIEEIEKPAVALIAVPDHLHPDVIKACIRSGLPFLVVKPAVTRMADFEAIEKLLSEKRGFGMVDYHKVYDEANRMIRQAIENGDLGDLQHVYSQQTQRRAMIEIYARWFEQNPDLNVNHYLGCHYIHLTHFLTRAQPQDVRAIPRFGVARERLGRAVADLITTQIRWTDREGKPFTSYHIAGWADPDETTAMTYQELEVIGSGGRIRSDQRDRGYRKATVAAGAEVANPYFFQLPNGANEAPGGPDLSGQYGYKSVRTFFLAARDVLAGNTKTRELDDHLPTFRQSAVTTSILEAADESLQRNGEIVAIR